MTDRRRDKEHSLTIRPEYCELVDYDHRAALILSQAAHWQSVVNSDPASGTDDGWFWKTAEQWQAETMIPPRAQRRKREVLRKYDFWQEEKRGMPAKMHFRVDFDALDEALAGMRADAECPTKADEPSDKGGQIDRPRADEPSDKGGRSVRQGSDDPSGGSHAHNAPARTDCTTDTTDRQHADDTLTSEPAPASDPDTSDGPDPSVYFDHHGEPVPESERMDLTEYKRKWRELTGRTPDMGTKAQIDRTLAALAHWPRDEVVDAIETTVANADNPPSWGYFKAVLDSTDGGGGSGSGPELRNTVGDELGDVASLSDIPEPEPVSEPPDRPDPPDPDSDEPVDDDCIPF